MKLAKQRRRCQTVGKRRFQGEYQERHIVLLQRRRRQLDLTPPTTRVADGALDEPNGRVDLVVRAGELARCANGVVRHG